MYAVKFDVDDVGEVLDQLVGHDVADVLGSEPLGPPAARTRDPGSSR